MDLLNCETRDRCAECWHYRENVGCVLAFRLNDALRAESARPKELPLFSIAFRDATAPAAAEA